MTSELAIVGLFRSRARIQCPAVQIVAVPNGAKRGPRAQRQAKQEGMQAGFPDVMAIAPGKIAFLEFKRPGGKPTVDQLEWLDRLDEMGFAAGVFDDPDCALEWLRGHQFPFLFERRAA